MTPKGIGVPVAATPGLVPHCDVLTAVLVGLLVGVLLLLLLDVLLLHPAAASIPVTATKPTTARAPNACFRILTSPTSRWQRLTYPFLRGRRNTRPVVARG
jgi:hypothetical protein